MLATALRLDVNPDRLGQEWPHGRDSEASCEDFRGDNDRGSTPIQGTWIFHCRSERASGTRELFYYDFDLDHPPALQQMRHVLRVPSGSDAKTWMLLQRTLASEFASVSKGAVDSSGSDSSLVYVRAPAYDVSIGLGLGWESRALELEINVYSRRFLDLARDKSRRDSTEVWRPESLPRSRRDGILRAVRAQAPELAAALSGTVPRMADTTVIFPALRRASTEMTGEARDLRLYVAHRWTSWVVYGLGDSSVAEARAIDAAIEPYGGRVVEGHYGGWVYDDGLRTKFSRKPGEGQWADEAFLEEIGQCSSMSADPWKDVLQRGESYLAKFPRSGIAPEILLCMAEAHETAWSLSKSEPITDFLDPAAYRLDAPRHRAQAIDLYERYLRLRPRSPEADVIRHRMYRLRLDVDTDFHKYFCPMC